jgi:hypothetical protein
MAGNWLTKSINDFRHANVKQTPAHQSGCDIDGS